MSPFACDVSPRLVRMDVVTPTLVIKHLGNGISNALSRAIDASVSSELDRAFRVDGSLGLNGDAICRRYHRTFWLRCFQTKLSGFWNRLLGRSDGYCWYGSGNI